MYAFLPIRSLVSLYIWLWTMHHMSCLILPSLKGLRLLAEFFSLALESYNILLMFTMVFGTTGFSWRNLSLATCVLAPFKCTFIMMARLKLVANAARTLMLHVIAGTKLVLTVMALDILLRTVLRRQNVASASQKRTSNYIRGYSEAL